MNFLGDCFVNNFYIYENVCFFFLLSKKLLVQGSWLGTGVLSSSMIHLSVQSLHLMATIMSALSLVEFSLRPMARDNCLQNSISYTVFSPFILTLWVACGF